MIGDRAIVWRPKLRNEYRVSIINGDRDTTLLSTKELDWTGGIKIGIEYRVVRYKILWNVGVVNHI